jgi:dihydrofolate reductase
MKLSVIVATGENNEIGKANALLWRLPADLKRFKALTTGHAVVMGRRTYLSLPNGALPNRINVVLSSDRHLQAKSCLLFSSLDAALVHLRDEQEVFIIGGAMLYEKALPLADKLYLTRVHASFPDADAFFPPVDYSEWKLNAMQTIPADEENACDTTFYEYKRIRTK